MAFSAGACDNTVVALTIDASPINKANFCISGCVL